MANTKPSSGASNGTRTWVTILLLLLFYPAGLILMWAWSRWPTWVKALITALSVVFVAIFAILAVIGLTVFTGLQRGARDATRVSELKSIDHALTVSVQEDPKYSLCGEAKAPCVGRSDTDGTSWLKPPMDFNTGKVPVDLLNTSVYHYTYCSDGKKWELDAKMESPTYQKQAQDDGGDDPNLYEVGSDLTLCPK